MRNKEEEEEETCDSSTVKESNRCSKHLSAALLRSKYPALSFQLVAQCGRARRTNIELPHGIVETPIFMPVGTHGTVKGLTTQNLEDIGYKIILGNTYHLGNRPSPSVLRTFGGIHNLMGWKRNVLTDSGGFQMVSLLKLAKITEEGVTFTNPVDNSSQLLTPEISMSLQNCIGADIMMALDDVVCATLPVKERVHEATLRTTRWLDRCIGAHQRASEQNLFGIVQGGIHTDLRMLSLKDLKARDLPGYAIGGLSGGEEKDAFSHVVELCTRPTDDIGLPQHKPRYLMGVGYPLDVVVCVALGVDMFDCVYPARTGRFGTALVPEGTLRLKQRRYAEDNRPLQKDCRCIVCKRYTRAYLHKALTSKALGTRLLTLHNLTYMYDLCESMRKAIQSNAFPDFVIQFIKRQFHTHLKQKYENCDACRLKDPEKGCTEEVDKEPPIWVRTSLNKAGVCINELYNWERSTSTPHHTMDVGGNRKVNSLYREGVNDEEDYVDTKRCARLYVFNLECIKLCLNLPKERTSTENRNISLTISHLKVTNDHHVSTGESLVHDGCIATDISVHAALHRHVIEEAEAAETPLSVFPYVVHTHTDTDQRELYLLFVIPSQLDLYRFADTLTVDVPYTANGAGPFPASAPPLELSHVTSYRLLSTPVTAHTLDICSHVGSERNIFFEGHSKDNNCHVADTCKATSTRRQPIDVHEEWWCTSLIVCVDGAAEVSFYSYDQRFASIYQVSTHTLGAQSHQAFPNMSSTHHEWRQAYQKMYVKHISTVEGFVPKFRYTLKPIIVRFLNTSCVSRFVPTLAQLNPLVRHLNSTFHSYVSRCSFV